MQLPYVQEKIYLSLSTITIRTRKLLPKSQMKDYPILHYEGNFKLPL